MNPKTPTHNTTTGTDFNSLMALAEILVLAAVEPGTMDDAMNNLHAIEDAAKAALFNR